MNNNDNNDNNEKNNYINEIPSFHMNNNYSGITSDLDNIHNNKIYGIVDIPFNKKVKKIKLYGRVNSGFIKNDENRNVRINVYEKKINKNSHNKIGSGYINEIINIDTFGTNDNYLVVEVDILDTIITGGFLEVYN